MTDTGLPQRNAGDESSATAERAVIYHRAILAATPRLLGALDRERESPTAGSFDRDHWAWKFRDCPGNMLQTGVLPMAWLYQHEFPGNRYHRQPRVLEWLVLAIEAMLKRQHADGSFDSVGPNTKDHGVTLAMAHVLATTVPPLMNVLPSILVERTMDAARRAAAFAGRTHEDYAFISNHHALFALAWLRVGRWLADPDLTARADQELQLILRHQSPDGWYLEYDGPDPGYESLGFHYLAQFAAERPSDGLDGSLKRALEFYEFCVMPDGSVGGVVGSRRTSLWYPAGFELLASSYAAAGVIAERINPRLDDGQVVTLSSVDANNLPTLLHSYCLASAGTFPATGARSLPCDAASGLRFFPDSGLTVASTGTYYAICAARKGGVLSARRSSNRTGGYEDSGYVARANTEVSSSGFIGLSEVRESTDGVKISVRFGRVSQEVLTPFKFVCLRLLNLTLFRSLRLAAWIRRAIVRRLITARTPGAVTLERAIRFLDQRIEIDDAIGNMGTEAVTVLPVKTFAPIHMGSARYFHPHELVTRGPPVPPDGSQQLGAGGRVVRHVVVDFTDEVRVSVATPGGDDGAKSR